MSHYFHYYYWNDTTAGGLFVPECIIRTVVNISELTWFIKYINHCMKYLLLRQSKGIGNVIFSLPFVVFYLHFEKNQKV